ncbi:hypothetical protein VNO80_27072 [Phaseolus coccineus]|uniref:Uncharacterized protein n=1 Tax=Phaseolus coccineus TaxID=3886 RepID=A0AAN9LG53_PHACN
MDWLGLPLKELHRLQPNIVWKFQQNCPFFIDIIHFWVLLYLIPLHVGNFLKVYAVHSYLTESSFHWKISAAHFHFIHVTKLS